MPRLKLIDLQLIIFRHYNLNIN